MLGVTDDYWYKSMLKGFADRVQSTLLNARSDRRAPFHGTEKDPALVVMSGLSDGTGL